MKGKVNGESCMILFSRQAFLIFHKQWTNISKRRILGVVFTEGGEIYYDFYVFAERYLEELQSIKIIWEGVLGAYENNVLMTRIDGVFSCFIYKIC